MFQVNENYLKLPGSYLFSTVGKKVKAYSEAHPDKKVIRLGIGDVTQPLVPAIIKAMHEAVAISRRFSPQTAGSLSVTRSIRFMWIPM